MLAAIRVWLQARYLLLACALLLAGLYWRPSGRLELDRSVESMFPSESRALGNYQQLQRTFAGNEIVLAVLEDPLWRASDGQGLARIRAMRLRLQQVEGVRAVLAIDQPLPGNLILSDDPLAEKTRKLLEGFTHSAESHSAESHTIALVCLLSPPDSTRSARAETMRRLREIVDSPPAPLRPGFLVGEPVLLVEGFQFLEQDGHRLATWSVCLLGITIILCFRSIRWVVMPLAVVQWSLLVTRGVLAHGAWELTMVSSMLSAVIMVIGVATMVHVLTQFAECRGQGLSVADSLEACGRVLFWPVLWSCLTDAAGFLSLTVSRVGPIQDFGVMMTVGSLAVLLGVILLTPGLATLGPWDQDPHPSWGQAGLRRTLQRMLETIVRHRHLTIGGLTVLTIIALWGLRRLPIETDFTRNFRSDTQIAQSYGYVEEHLGGAGVCDIILPAPPDLNWDFLVRVHTLEQRLRGNLPSRSARPEHADTAITSTFSLAGALIQLAPVDLARQNPVLRRGFVQSGLLTLRHWMPQFYTAIHGQDPRDGSSYLRIMLRVRERQTAEQKRALIRYLTEEAQRDFPEAKITGYFVLLSELIDSVLSDQWRTFAVSIVAIGLLMFTAFGDVRLVLIAMIPNTFPVLIVLGTMGWLSQLPGSTLRANMGTAMIAAVSLGLSIDSSVHYILGVLRHRRRGQSWHTALSEVQGTVGQSLVLSTVALMVGFTVLATSRFVPTIYFGTLMTLAMLGGLIGNLVALPVLLQTLVATSDDAESQADSTSSPQTPASPDLPRDSTPSSESSGFAAG